jgi:hypothetical protein
MHRHRREKLIALAPAVPPSRSFPAVRVLRTDEELEVAQDRARAFERRDAERYQRHQSSSELATVQPLERSPEFRPLRDLHPAGSGLSAHDRAGRFGPETMKLMPSDRSGPETESTRRIDPYETRFGFSERGYGMGTQPYKPQ